MQGYFRKSGRQEHVFLAVIAKGLRDYTLKLNSPTFRHGINFCSTTMDPKTSSRPIQSTRALPDLLERTS